jgi:hypothetical protein
MSSMSQGKAEMEEKGNLDQNSFGSLFVLCLCRWRIGPFWPLPPDI